MHKTVNKLIIILMVRMKTYPQQRLSFAFPSKTNKLNCSPAAARVLSCGSKKLRVYDKIPYFSKDYL